MKRILCISAALLATLVFNACDWESGGSDNKYSTRYNWVNFSGTYRGVNGGILVTDYTQIPGTEPRLGQSRGETVATGNGSRTVFSGTVRFRNIVPGSFTLSSAGFQLTDNGTGVLAGSGATGSIEYGTGSWSVDFGGFAPDNGTPITVSYGYTIEGSGATGPRAGTSGFTLYTFVVQQSGQQVIFTDNTGKDYTGTIGSIRSTGGASQDSPTSDNIQNLTVGDQVIGTFNVKGVSSANREVRMTGTLQGVIGEGGMMMDRRMFGTWIEAGGRTGNITGQAAPIILNLTDLPTVAGDTVDSGDTSGNGN